MSKQASAKSIFDRVADLDEAQDVQDREQSGEAGDPDESGGDDCAQSGTQASDGRDPDQADASADADGQAESDAALAGTSGEDAAAGPPGQRRRRLLTVAVGTLLITALGLSSFLGWRLMALRDTAAAGQAAMEAARNYAVVLTTLDTKDIDKNYREALDGATGEFKDQYSQGSAQLRQILIDNGAAGKGIVIDSAIKSATKTKVEVLLFVDQSVTNAVRTSPRIDRDRVLMTMELIDHRWLASKVEML
ncbi:Mce protein [Mycobacterium sp.]|uniref:Mce protein n=1 Tax=Mycobacterium sp. TaxID=1785 RepID=UPI003A88829C